MPLGIPVSGRSSRSEIIRLNLIWIIPAKELMRANIPLSHSCADANQTHYSMSSGNATPSPAVDGAAVKENEIRSNAVFGKEQPCNEEGFDNSRRTDGTSVPHRLTYYLKKVENQLVEYSLEARGIERVQEHERIPRLTWISYLQVFLLWMSVNLAANNITLGMLGPAVYGLSFLDSALCAVFGALVGSTASSWMATWGPISGIRTMVCFMPVQQNEKNSI